MQSIPASEIEDFLGWAEDASSARDLAEDREIRRFEEDEERRAEKMAQDQILGMEIDALGVECDLDLEPEEAD